MSDASEAEAAFQDWCDKRRRSQGIPDGEHPVWIVRYEDQGVPDEVFDGPDAEEYARRRFDIQRGAWSISLLQEVARA